MWRGNVEQMGPRDASRRSNVTASCTRLHSAFPAMIKEMFMLWMIQTRGERRAQCTTLRYTTLSTPSLHPSIDLFSIPSPSPFPSLLMSPSFPHRPSSPLHILVLSCHMYFWLRVAVLHGSTRQHSQGAMTSPLLHTTQPTPVSQLEPGAVDAEK